MTPMEAWGIISQNLTELTCLRVDKGYKSHTQREIDAQVICFHALKELEKREVADDDCN